ncbi:MAG TPA: hypothetical protein VGH73_14730 [Thermoanaerobaculia bacterium]|jgi:hypothetical protein
MHRVILALAVVTSLGLSGARPAAARELGLLERLDRLWSTVAGQPAAWAKLSGWFGSNGTPTKSAAPPTSSTTDRGWGMDPNGSSVLSQPSTTPTGLP